LLKNGTQNHVETAGIFDIEENSNMSNVDEMLINSLSAQVGGNTETTNQQGSEMENANGGEQIQPEGAVQTAETGNTSVMENQGQAQTQGNEATNTNNQQEQPVVDYDKVVGELTGGLFRNAEEFKASLPKFSEYDRLKQERDEFESKTKQDPFANPYVKKLNELLVGGASADQIENFHKINKVGDISALSPLDAKLAKMVLVDGWRESVAQLALNQEFPLEDYEEGSPERTIMEEKLRLSAEADKKSLEQFKSDNSVVSTQNAEQIQLQAAAKQKEHDDYVRANVPQIASQIQGMGEIEFKVKDGQPLKMKFDYPQEFKAQMGDKLFEYFSDGQTPITQETVAQAFKAINATYLDENFPKISQRIYETAWNAALEFATNKYENKSGLPQSSQVNPQGANTQQAYGDFLKGLVGSN